MSERQGESLRVRIEASATDAAALAAYQPYATGTPMRPGTPGAPRTILVPGAHVAGSDVEVSASDCVVLPASLNPAVAVLVPPIAAVYLTDFFVLSRRDYQAPVQRRTADQTNVNGLLAFALGAGVGIGLYYAKASLTGVPTIEAFFTAAITYWLLEQARMHAARDRLWRAG